MDASTVEKRPTAGIAITRTIIKPRRERYTRNDLLKAADIEPPPRVIVEGFDSFGRAKEFKQQSPTLEWQEKAGEFHEKPEVSRAATRLCHRRVPVFLRMGGDGLIDENEVEAGMSWLWALEFESGSPTSCSYGQARGKGGGTDRHDMAVEASGIILRAERRIADFRLYRWAKVVVLTNATADKAPLAPSIAHRGGAIPPATRRRHYTEALKKVASRLA